MLIEINSVSFGHKGNKNFVLKDCNLRLVAGRSYSLLGENGAGKSTLLELMMGMREPNQGTVLVDGIQMHSKDRILARRELVLIDFKLGFLPYSKKGDLISLYRSLYPRFETSKFEMILQKLNLDFSDFYSKLSSGQQVKVQLALALATNAKFFLIDEVTAVLDPKSRYIAFELLNNELERGAGYLLATNIAEDALSHTQNILLITEGVIEVSSKQDLAKYFNLKVG